MAFKVEAIKELTSMPHKDEAKALLSRLVLSTQPIMIKMKWKVKILKEFYPTQPSLLGLNVNRGSSIMIRLREAENQTLFLPWESLLGTMIHELTHNMIGEHSAEFYRTVDKLWDEVNGSSFSTSSTSIFSQPTYAFDGKYVLLGSSIKSKSSHTLSTRELAAEAAFKRINNNSNNAGGYKLGGSKSIDFNAAAASAAEKRKQNDDNACSSSKYQVTTGYKNENSSTKNVNLAIITSVPIIETDLWVCEICLEPNFISIVDGIIINKDEICGFCGNSQVGGDISNYRDHISSIISDDVNQNMYCLDCSNNMKCNCGILLTHNVNFVTNENSNNCNSNNYDHSKSNGKSNSIIIDLRDDNNDNKNELTPKNVENKIKRRKKNETNGTHNVIELT
eukprot:gene16786-22973_t